MRTRVMTVMAALLLASVPAANAQTPISPSVDLLKPANPSLYGQIDFGGRITSTTGDEARYQRYRDARDGVFFDIPLYYRENENWWVEASIQNAGYRDQRYAFTAAAPGKYKLRFLYDQTPTYISGDTKTPYSPRPEDNGFYGGTAGTLAIADSIRSGIENRTLDFRTAIENEAKGFSSRIRRDSLGFDLAYSVSPNWDAKIKFLNTKKQGNIPFGASFGFSLAVEIPLPIDSKTNDVGASIEWGNDKGSFRAGWDGSWYDNSAYQLIWENPTRITDRTYAAAYSAGDGTSKGRLVTWPTNTFNTFNLAGAWRMPARSALTGSFSYGTWDQNEALVPHTINTAIAAIPLERTTAEASAATTAFTLNYVARPSRVFDVNARYRYYQFDNTTAHFDLERADGGHNEYVRFDQVPEPFTNPAINKFGPEPFGYTRNYFDFDAAFTGMPYSAIRIGYGYYGAEPHFRVYENIKDHTVRLSYDVTGNQYVSFRSLYERSTREGEGVEDINGNGTPDVLEAAGEQPGMRQFDIADRKRDRFTLLANLTPSAIFGFNASVAWTKDDFDNPQQPEADGMGLQDYESKTYSLGFDVVPRDEVAFGASYEYETFGGMFRSRNASPGAQFLDANRNWSLDEDQKAQSFLLNLDLLKVVPNTEMRFGYDYTKYEGAYLYTIGSGYLPSAGVTIWPNQLPDITSNESRVTVDFRYFLRKNLALGFQYWYDDYNVADWALGPTTISGTTVTGIAQPPVEPGLPVGAVNGVMLNYLYRPYTANTFWLRLTYLF